jgi:hypothetical protein
MRKNTKTEQKEKLVFYSRYINDVKCLVKARSIKEASEKIAKLINKK